MRKLKIFLLTGVVFMFTSEVQATPAEHCFALYNELTSKAVKVAREQRQVDGLYSNLINQWQAQASSCQGTGIYEARLAQLHILNTDYMKAQAVLDSAKTSGFYDRYIELAALWLEYYKLAMDADTSLLLTRLKVFTEKHPDFDEAHGLYGFVLTMAQKPAEAIVELKKSLTSPVDLYDTYKALMLNYVNIQNYNSANEMMNEAYSINPAFTSDPEAMFIAIKISIEIKDFNTVENLFKVLKSRMPEAMEYEGFQKLYEEYQAAPK